jgi:outer membrane immunogenic protein
MRSPNFIFSAVVAISAIAGIGAVSAADLPARTYTKAPAVVIDPAYNWSGFYVGLNGGGAWSSDCWFSINDNVGEGCNHPTGGIAGGQAGFNWQWQSLVLGIEATGDWANISGGRRTLDPFTNPAANVILNSQLNNIETLAGRLGVSFNNVLLYGKGGAAWAGTKYNENAFGVLATVASKTQSGWVAGVGVEYGFTPNWSVGLEYDYLGFGTTTLPFTPVAAFAGPFNERISQNVQTLTARLNYRFNWAGPVVAKY